MIEGFSEGANLVLAVAKVQAQRLQHNAVGTEHLLLGLCSDADPTIAEVLKSAGVTHQAALSRVQSLERFHEGIPDGILHGHLPFTPRSRQTLAFAVEERLRREQAVVDASAILLGLIRQEDSRGTQILVGLGVNMVELRATVLNLSSS